MVSIPEARGGISATDRPSNIESMNDIRDAERGPDATLAELKVMLDNANKSQKAIYEDVTVELQTNTMAIISGAAGTGKSYLLKMFERHYKLQEYKVSILGDVI